MQVYYDEVRFGRGVEGVLSPACLCAVCSGFFSQVFLGVEVALGPFVACFLIWWYVEPTLLRDPSLPSLFGLGTVPRALLLGLFLRGAGPVSPVFYIFYLECTCRSSVCAALPATPRFIRRLLLSRGSESWNYSGGFQFSAAALTP